MQAALGGVLRALADLCRRTLVIFTFKDAGVVQGGIGEGLIAKEILARFARRRPSGAARARMPPLCCATICGASAAASPSRSHWLLDA